MFAQLNAPQSLSPRDLDDYLERGWFRMGQTIFTTNFLHFKDQFYSAIWLRVALNEFASDKTQEKIMKQNLAFRSEIKVATVTPEQEALYSIYRKSVSFEPSATLKDLLFRSVPYVIYNTYQINLYEGDKLIACGFFDLGKGSAAGIISFYDPAYKRNSLGKYLIYLKMNYCKDAGLKYFYPGYFVPGYPFFNYKLSIGKSSMEYLQLSSQQWFPIGNFSDGQIPFKTMEGKLAELKMLLAQNQMVSNVLKYEFFDAGLVPELMGAELFDFPILLHCPELEDGNVKPMIVYDVRDEQFHLINCLSVWASDSPGLDSTIYGTHLLKAIQYLYTTDVVEEMVSVLSMEMSIRSLRSSGDNV